MIKRMMPCEFLKPRPQPSRWNLMV
jgi:hypothetical protein